MSDKTPHLPPFVGINTKYSYVPAKRSSRWEGPNVGGWMELAATIAYALMA
ncbi:hypothetical protein NVV93_12575 [Pseudomonas sp. LS44]|uniref:hypothetical protein n=1 Tax=Pseudomonas sp. LS44 TaxID=1357074 RepID=UPI00215A7934|nr:hypothetical protein [Pseudomonas sp. LS44]UVE16446.1 hypothetical protein NVV93_12575 [Pseudomonas sp. LS44]